MENSISDFSFETVKEFSGMFLRKPFDSEVLFIAVLEVIMLEEDLPAAEQKGSFVKEKELNEI